MYWCMVQYTVVNHSHFTDPAICPPGFNLSRRLWSTLNRFRAGQGRYAANSCSVAPGLRPVLHMWKPTTDNGSYRQSLSNLTISCLFVVPTSSRWRLCFMAGHAKLTIEEWRGGGRKGQKVLQFSTEHIGPSELSNEGEWVSYIVGCRLQQYQLRVADSEHLLFFMWLTVILCFLFWHCVAYIKSPHCRSY